METAPVARTRRSLLMAKGKMPAFLKGKYTDEKDKKKDAEMTKRLSPKEKAKFKEEDKKHPKPKTMAEDKASDAKIINNIKSKGKEMPKGKPAPKGKMPAKKGGKK
jgi:hypothetical protein